MQNEREMIVCKCCLTKSHKWQYYRTVNGNLDTTCRKCRLRSARIRAGEKKQFLTDNKLLMSEMKSAMYFENHQLPWLSDYLSRMEASNELR